MWNTFCILVDSERKVFNTTLNDQQILHIDNYSRTHEKTNENIFLLNGYSFKENIFAYPFKGKVTDVNIWNSVLSKADIKNWSACTKYLPGTFLDWNSVKIKHDEKLKIENVDREKICSTDISRKIVAFNMKMQFLEGEDLCKKVGGKVCKHYPSNRIFSCCNKRACVSLSRKFLCWLQK